MAQLVEEKIISYLSDHLDGVKVASTVPADAHKPGALVIVGRTGGLRSRFLDSPIVTCDCYEESQYKASLLAAKVVSLVYDLACEDDKISAVESSHVYRNVWTASGWSCYTVSCSIVANL